MVLQQMELVSNRQVDSRRAPAGSEYRLKVFEATARHRSVRAAAGDLRMTPREVSRSLRELEAAMRVSLFTRRRGVIGLTRAGDVLFARMAREPGDAVDASGRVALRQVV